MLRLRVGAKARVSYKRRIVRRLAKARLKQKERRKKMEAEKRTLRLRANPQSRALGDLVIDHAGPQEVPLEFKHVSQESHRSFGLVEEVDLPGLKKATAMIRERRFVK